MWYVMWDVNTPKSGKHPHNALSPAKVRMVATPGRYTDGNGLYLLVDKSGAKRWILRTVIHGKRTDLGLGGLTLVTLAQARDQAVRLRKIARDDGDPREEKRAKKKAGITFESAAITVHESNKETWKNEKHADQWINTLRTYAFPHFGSKPVHAITSADIVTALSPIWTKKPETARRVLQRIRTVLDWAKASGLRTGDNPVEGVTKGLPKPKRSKEHHAALPYKQIPAFLKKMHAGPSSEIAKLAFEFLILTGARTSEVLLALPAEADLKAKVWVVPPDRMKAGAEHRVPLPARCVAIVKRAMELSAGQEFLFAGEKTDRPMSNMVFLMMLRNLGLEVTAHGFRSSFRDWASEQTNFPSAVCEAALAHTVRDKTEAAYNRTDLFEKRRALMNSWAKYCATMPKVQAARR